MRSNILCAFKSKALLAVQVAGLACALAILIYAAPQHATSTGCARRRCHLPTPQLAAEAIIKAAGDFDVPTLLNILGPDGQGSGFFGGRCQRIRTLRSKVRRKPTKRTWWSSTPKIRSAPSSRLATKIGPFPFPSSRNDGKWYFDTKAGREEVLFRRIGENELDAITICRGFVEAQNEYAQTGPRQFRRESIRAEDYQHAWKTGWAGLAKLPTAVGEVPIGEGVANALEEGYVDKTKPFHGYYFKILKGQGPNATSGQARLRDRGSDDRRVCACCRTGRISCHRREDIPGQLRRGRVSEGPGTRILSTSSRPWNSTTRIRPGTKRTTKSSGCGANRSTQAELRQPPNAK